MTRDDVIAKLAEIRAMANDADDERAHALQYDLYVAVLVAITDGSAKPSARALAQEALKVRDIGFSRWYA